MKKLIVLMLLFGVTLMSNAQAKIEFKSETIDYGNIAKDSDGVRIFEFINTGDSELIISKVQSSCGCTVPEKPKGPIGPGDKGIIKVKYDTKRLGPIRKTVTVYSNATEPIKALKIKGTVAANKSILEN